MSDIFCPCQKDVGKGLRKAVSAGPVRSHPQDVDQLNGNYSEFNNSTSCSVKRSELFPRPKREGRNEIFTIAPKYYQRAENWSAKMTIAPKKIL